MKISGIYKIINKVNGKYYVGSSKDILDHRWPRHKHALKGGYHKNDHLQSAWNKYGENNFGWIIVEKISKNNLKFIEQKYLDIAKTEQDKCYNLKFVVSGGDISEYSKNKIRKANKGKILSRKTKRKISIRTKIAMNAPGMFEKMSKIRKNIKPTKKARKNMSKAQKGRKHSPETIEKMRISHLGNKNPMFGKKPWNYNIKHI